MNNVSRIHASHILLREVEAGSVFKVVSPKVEGKKHVKNDSIYRKEADSHCIQLSNGHDCIFHRNTVVEVLPNSRFSGDVAIAVSA